ASTAAQASTHAAAYERRIVRKQSDMTPCPSVKHSEGRVFAYKKGGNLVEKDAGPGKRRFRPFLHPPRTIR
ncbi:MAG: hypothetical protein WAN75_40960, partial [Xanthobacteraceae bacterium]